MTSVAGGLRRLGYAEIGSAPSSSRPSLSQPSRIGAPIRRMCLRRIVRLKRAMTGPRMMAALEAYLMRLPPCCM